MVSKQYTYSMAFTTGGLFLAESVKVAELYLAHGDEGVVREAVHTDNLLQSRTMSSLKRIFRHYRFIDQALGKNSQSRSNRDYFLKDYVRRYKKRLIYWLFSSPKGSFSALIYMHRYRPDTVSVILNDYLREFRTKLTANKNHLEAVSIGASSTPAEKSCALKEIEKIKPMIIEMEEYERDTLYPLATRQLEIDLDDGVKANYPKFAPALKKIPGLEAKDE